MSQNTEKIGGNPSTNIESETPKAEVVEHFGKQEKVAHPDDTAELSPRDLEARAEKARQEALETATSAEKGEKGVEAKKDKQPRQRVANKKQRDISYKRTMKHVQEELPLGSKVFSKVIHIKAVEKASDILGSTIARPNAILSGAVMAFIFTLAMYAIAKNFGYVLSGFETIAAFIAGWIVGVVYDYLRILITGKKA